MISLNFAKAAWIAIIFIAVVYAFCALAWYQAKRVANINRIRNGGVLTIRYYRMRHDSLHGSLLAEPCDEEQSTYYDVDLLWAYPGTGHLEIIDENPRLEYDEAKAVISRLLEKNPSAIVDSAN